jgi:hypothetical protein
MRWWGNAEEGMVGPWLGKRVKHEATCGASQVGEGSGFRLAGGWVGYGIMGFTFRPITNYFSVWACGTCSVEWAE